MCSERLRGLSNWDKALSIYQFKSTPQSCGSGRHDCINLTMRRIPRVNQEVLLQATFLGWSAGLFFAWGRMMSGVPLARGHRDVEGQGPAVLNYHERIRN